MLASRRDPTTRNGFFFLDYERQYNEKRPATDTEQRMCDERMSTFEQARRERIATREIIIAQARED